MAKVDLYPNLNSPPADAKVQTGTPEAGNKFAADVHVYGGSVTLTGDVHIRAPTGPFTISVATVTSVAADPIPVPLAARVSLSIRNKGAVTVYFGEDAFVTADDTATGGWEIGPGEDFNVDLDDSNSFFLITPAASSAVVKIFEIAST